MSDAQAPSTGCDGCTASGSAAEGVVQVQTGVEVAGAQQVGDAPVGAFGHTVGLGLFGPDHQSGMQSLRAMGPASTSRR